MPYLFGGVLRRSRLAISKLGGFGAKCRANLHARKIVEDGGNSKTSQTPAMDGQRHISEAAQVTVSAGGVDLNAPLRWHLLKDSC